MPDAITPFPTSALTTPPSANSPAARTAAGDFDALMAGTRPAARSVIIAAALTVDPPPLDGLSPGTPEPPLPASSPIAPDPARPTERQARAATGKTLPLPPCVPSPDGEGKSPHAEAAPKAKPGSAAKPLPCRPSARAPAPVPSLYDDSIEPEGPMTQTASEQESPGPRHATNELIAPTAPIVVSMTAIAGPASPTERPSEEPIAPAAPAGVAGPASREPDRAGSTPPPASATDAAAPPLATTDPTAAGVQGRTMAFATAPAASAPLVDPGDLPPVLESVQSPPIAQRRQPRVAIRPNTSRAPRPIAPGSLPAQATDRLLRTRPNTAFAEPLPAAQPLSAATAGAPLTPAATEASPTAAQPVDTQAREWRTQMLDRIERFAAAEPAPGRETRITLSPDALGEVAVRLRETDRGIEVVLDAAPEARALLAEAAPRLTELAESRGLRLTLQQPGSGDGGGDRPQPQPRPQADTPLPNRRAAPRSAADTPTDERIA